MSMQVYRVHKVDEYRKAGATDLIRLQPAPGANPLYVMKHKLETLTYAITHAEFTHLSGPTGSAKTSLLEALWLVPENLGAVCAALGFAKRPLRLYPIQMAIFEAPGDLYQRRALRGGSTFDEDSPLVQALVDASQLNGDCYKLVWLREIGRVHSSSVQNGLLDLMCRGTTTLPNGRQLDASHVAWVADSNYAAEDSALHTLVAFDDGLKRRFAVNVTMEYLSAEQELRVLQHLREEGDIHAVADEVLGKLVKLGEQVRRHKLEGNLQTVAPPTIYGYLAFLRMFRHLSHLSLQQIALATLLGNAGADDSKHVEGVFNDVFGLQPARSDDPVKGGGLF